MQLRKVLYVVGVLVGVAHCNEEVAEQTASKEQETPLVVESEAVSSNDSADLPAEARVIDSSHSPSRTNPKYQTQQINAIPSYPNYHRPMRYNPANRAQGPVPSYQGPSHHPKEKLSEKKPLPGLKHTKPEYYPKVSSYASIPNQPNQIPSQRNQIPSQLNQIPNQPSQVNEPHSPRFVPDPSRGQTIETISAHELQHLTQPQPFGLAPHGVHMPHYTAGGAPYMTPYGRPQGDGSPTGVTVKYEQTEHSFMDRMWGEVQTMRQTITEDYLGAIPNMLRSVWNYIVGAVSATSRMFDVGVVDTVTDVSARMIQSVDWMAAFRLLVNQLS